MDEFVATLFFALSSGVVIYALIKMLIEESKPMPHEKK